MSASVRGPLASRCEDGGFDVSMTKLIVWIALVMACGGTTHATALSSGEGLMRLRVDASIASMRGDHATCVARYDRAAALDPRSPGDPYNAAACHAGAGEVDAAFRALDRAIDRGYHELELMRADTDLERLHGDPRWADVERRMQARLDAYLQTVNIELYRIVTEDQKARMVDFTKVDMHEFEVRDAERLKRVKEIVEAGGAKVSDDYFNAALVAQHGETPDDYRLARTLALKAAELDPNNRTARWLAAAATDREFVNLGKPQRFGTQSTSGKDGVLKMLPVDPTVTDEESARWSVPSLADQERGVDAMNAMNAGAQVS